MARKIFISTSKFSEHDRQPLEKLKCEGFDVTLNPYKRRLTKDEALEHYTEYDGLIAGLEVLDKEVIEHSRLKVISRCGTGMSNVDVHAAKEKGVFVVNTPDAPTNSVAEITLGAMLSVARHLSAMNQALHSSQWTKLIGFELTGKTVLMIGFGRIGKRLAELLKPFQVQLLVVDPAYPLGKQSFGTVVDLHEGIPLADIITFHCSGDQCIFGAQEFSLLKDKAYLFNAARGGLIDEAQLCLALDSGKVAGGWLDAFLEEPYVGPLTQYPQLLLTPHIGSNSIECRRVMEMQAAENLINCFKNHG